MILPEGTILEERYQIEQLLAEGGMGAIYQGYDIKLDIRVALKENFLHTPESIMQFEQEARILARMHHPNLPRVIDHFNFDNQQYLVMDFVQGQNLWEIYEEREEPLEEDVALNYIIQVCDAVNYLHQQDPSIIHRDIKPQNIKVTPDGRAILVDFGIAKVAEGGSQTRTGAQAITPGFSPPEQYGGMGTTPVSDIYGLGATLYSILTGTYPPDSISIMAGGAKFEPPNIVNTKLSLQVSQAIEYAMQVNRDDRPESVAVWQQDLEDIRAGRTVPFRLVPKEEEEDDDDDDNGQTVILDSKTRETMQIPPSSPMPATTAGQAKGGPPWLWIGIAVVALIVAIGAVAFMLGRSGGNNNEQSIDTQAILMALAATATEQAKTGATPDTNLEATLVAMAATATTQARSAAIQPTETPVDTPTPAPTATPVPPTTTPTPEPTATLVPPADTPTPESTATSVPPTNTPTTAPTTPPQQIAFVSNRDGNKEIYVMNTDGSGQTNLTNSPNNNDETPAWSPDGRQIAFARSSVTEQPIIANTTIQVMDSDGNNVSRLITQAGQPAWSPDGTQLAVSGGDDRISTIDIDGSNQVQLTPGSGQNPVWSPDGQQIVFDNIADLFVINSDGSDVTARTSSPADERYGAWSPDGRQIAFATNGHGDWEIYVMKADGSNATRLTNSPADDVYPTWSPDGTQLAFASNRDGDWEIYVMKADGSGQINITNNHSANDEQPSWSP